MPEKGTTTEATFCKQSPSSYCYRTCPECSVGEGKRKKLTSYGLVGVFGLKNLAHGKVS
jgi:hypothetical protein